MTQEQNQVPIIQIIKSNWIFILFIFASFATWVTLTNKVDSHTESIEALHRVDAVTTASNNQILVELSGIRADLFWLKNNLNK